MILPDKALYNKNVSLNQQIFQETQCFLSISANRNALQKVMEQVHSHIILTSEE